MVDWTLLQLVLATLMASIAVSTLAATARPGLEKTYTGHVDLEHLSHDRDLTEKIMRKRQEEMQRRTKLLDPRKRQFGVDHAVLDAQLADKRLVAEVEAAEESQHAENHLMQDHVLQTLEDLKHAATREREKAARDFSLTNLRKEQRREFALSDPDALKKEIPIDIDDSSIGPSSFLKFGGDAPVDQKAHKKALQQQQREMLLEQIREKEDRARAEREADRRFDEHTLMSAQVRAHCEHAEQNERRQDKIEEAEYNRKLAEFHSQRRQARSQRDSEEKARHIDGVIHDDRFTEAQDWKLGQNGKLLSQEYKRLTLDQEHHHYNTMAQQVLEKQARRQVELAEEAEYSQAVNTQVSVLSALEAERMRQQKLRRQKVVDHNQQLAAQKHELDADERRKYRSFEYEP